MKDYMNPIIIKGLKVYPFHSMDELVKRCSSEKKLVLSVNAEILMRADDEMKTIINDHIGYADGVGTVKALRRKGSKNVRRIPGCELWIELIKKYGDERKFFLCGSTSEVIGQVVRKLQEEYPHLQIVGYRDGFFQGEEEFKQLEEVLIKEAPDFVFVATGFPFQEKLMARLWGKYPATYLSLGGSFDVYAGTVKRAPRFFQRLGLEWFYRLIKQPVRIKRQSVLVRFVWLDLTRQL